MDQPVKVKAANPARGELNGERNVSLSSFAPENLASRDRFDRPVPCHPAHSPHSESVNSAYSWDFSQFPRWRPLIYTAIRSIPTLFGHAIAFFLFERPGIDELFSRVDRKSKMATKKMADNINPVAFNPN